MEGFELRDSQSKHNQFQKDDIRFQKKDTRFQKDDTLCLKSNTDMVQCRSSKASRMQRYRLVQNANSWLNCGGGGGGDGANWDIQTRQLLFRYQCRGDIFQYQWHSVLQYQYRGGGGVLTKHSTFQTWSPEESGPTQMGCWA